MTSLNKTACKLQADSLRTDSKAAANMGLAKVAVQWLNQALCFDQSLCLADSESFYFTTLW